MAMNMSMFNSTLFQQSLQDLVKGIRSNRRQEDDYVRAKLAEIAIECRTSDIAKKTTAVLKLTHLQMMGCNVSFASFHVVEVMCATDFPSKRVGYLAAAQSFSPTTDVLLLTTNQFKKDLTNGRLQDCSQALTCLAKLATESLACDLLHDVALLLSSPRPYIRKKALLVLYRFIMVYPDTLAVVSQKFVDCLSDQDPGVVCAAVTVTCELARESPKTFLSLAPVLYQLLTTSSNNWMLIKIVKLMGVLTPLEPRLGKKLAGPLTTLMRSTRAKSLLYECCCTVTQGLMDHQEAVQLCATRLSDFMVDPDQNLKYLGLLSMRKLVKGHPDVAMKHRDLILDCLDDVDVGIRMRALDLVAEFVTRRTLRDISRILLRKLRAVREPVASPMYVTSTELIHDLPPSSATASGYGGGTQDPEIPYREALAERLLVPGIYVRGEGYPLLSSGEDFTWYIATVLGGLARTPGLSHNIYETIGNQLTELVSRVEAVRPAIVAIAVALLRGSVVSSTLANLISSVLQSSADEQNLLDLEGTPGRDADSGDAVPGNKIGGKAIEEGEEERISASTPTSRHPTSLPQPALSVSVPFQDDHGRTAKANDSPLSPLVITAAAWVTGEYADLLRTPQETAMLLISYPVTCRLDSNAQVALIGAAVKVYAECDVRLAEKLYQPLMSRLDESIQSDLAEVYERSLLFKALVEQAGSTGNMSLRPLFEGKLGPVDMRSQANVAIPEGLDLDQSLLDTGHLDLYSFLIQEGDDVGGGESYDGDEEEDLFKTLEQSGNLRFGGGLGSPDASTGQQSTERGNLVDVDKKASPYYLSHSGGERVCGRSGSRIVAADSNAYHNDLVDLGDDSKMSPSATPVNVYKDDVPVGVVVDDDSRSPVQDTIRSGNSRYDNAFKGVFDGNSSRNGGELKPKRRRRKKNADGGPKRRIDAAVASEQKTLISLDFDAVLPEVPLSNTSADSIAPKHLGGHADLLLS
jgi:Adaptin N terminal region